jgi:hypothetical protein
LQALDIDAALRRQPSASQLVGDRERQLDAEQGRPTWRLPTPMRLSEPTNDGTMRHETRRQSRSWPFVQAARHPSGAAPSQACVRVRQAADYPHPAVLGPRSLRSRLVRSRPYRMTWRYEPRPGGFRGLPSGVAEAATTWLAPFRRSGSLSPVKRPWKGGIVELRPYDASDFALVSDDRLPRPRVTGWLHATASRSSRPHCPTGPRRRTAFRSPVWTVHCSDWLRAARRRG